MAMNDVIFLMIAIVFVLVAFVTAFATGGFRLFQASTCCPSCAGAA
jgi:FlaG/FlaF family flagellin (archaellin)